MDDQTVSTAPAEDAASLSEDLLNVPNQITIARLVLTVICLFALALGWYMTALVLFVIAASTDWVDGYWARRFNQITQLGRILDPFADKFIICGVFIFLCAVPQSAIAPWMAVVVVTREMLVTGLRSFFEQRSIDFSASMAGKLKMVFQCIAVALSLYRLTYLDPPTGEWLPVPPAWLTYSLISMVWLAVLMTIYSGWGYVSTALKFLRS